MNIEKVKKIYDLYSEYEHINSLITEKKERIVLLQNEILCYEEQKEHIIEEISTIDEEISTVDAVDYDIVMGSPLHKKLEAMLSEYHINREDFKEYVDVTSMKYVTVGLAKKFFDNPELFRDAINGRRR